MVAMVQGTDEATLVPDMAAMFSGTDVTPVPYVVAMFHGTDEATMVPDMVAMLQGTFEVTAVPYGSNYPLHRQS